MLRFSETRFREIVSGQRGGVSAWLFRLLLSCAVPAWWAAVTVRNWAYGTGLWKVHPAPVPVISLGNLTTGGTGKTPLAAWVARWYRDRGVRVCFLSRGYRAGNSSLNDEALVLERLCPDVPHLQNPDRVSAARTAREELFTQLLLLDDGFQHRRLQRDLDIVLIDATNPWGFGHLLPRGLLREPVAALRRAGLVVITRVDLVSSDQVTAIRQTITRVAPQAPVAEVALVADQLVNWSGATAASLSGRVGALAAIGNPDSFSQTLSRLGLPVAGRCDYPDHHRYTRDDISDIGRWGRHERLDVIATTRKDLVKLQVDAIEGIPVWCVDQRVEVRTGADVLDTALAAMLPRIPLDPEDEFDTDAAG